CASGKLFCIPRDARRVLQIEVQEGSRDVKVRPVGPDFGDVQGKFTACVRGNPAVSTSFF
ncbi:unnamed protein product, partial [Prorocentrum cordatum]